MPSVTVPQRVIGTTRILLGSVVIGILVYAYVVGIPLRGASLFDYLGYFTNLTSLLAAVILIVRSSIVLCGGVAPRLDSARAVAVSCMIVVAVVYNVLVPGTGSAPAWVSLSLHAIFPVALVADWTLVDDRPVQPWRRLWLVLPYPLLWLTVVLVRGVTDGWVPYGFLLPERGVASLLATVAGLLLSLLASGALVWALSRLHGVIALDGRRSLSDQSRAQP